jgi:hypothetical protein
MEIPDNYLQYQPPDKQGNNRDGVVAIIGLMVKRAFAITGGIRGRNKGKKPPFTEPNLHRPFQKACLPSPKGH